MILQLVPVPMLYALAKLPWLIATAMQSRLFTYTRGSPTYTSAKLFAYIRIFLYTVLVSFSIQISTRPSCLTPSFANRSLGMFVHKLPKRISSTSIVPLTFSQSYTASTTGSSTISSTLTAGPTSSKVITPEASLAPV